jgi:hypothetical protein
VRRAIGSRQVPIERFTDVWTKLSDLFIDHPLVSYAIMSEPVGLPRKGDLSPAELWEQAAQAALSAIRANGDNHLILVNGYRWSSLADWPKIHPDPFIDDPANNFVYTAHHYWDRDSSGSYEHSYDDEVTYAENHE